MVRTITPDLRRVIDADNYCGETPTWIPEESALYWVNNEDPPQLHRWSETEAKHDIWPMPERIGGFALDAAGGMIVALASGIYDFNLATGTLTRRVASPAPENAVLHESRCDPTGRFWIGTMDKDALPPDLKSGRGCLYRMEGDALVAVLNDVVLSNGLAFSPDGRTLYHTDSPTLTVYAWDLDPVTGALSNQREFARLTPGEGIFDGATIDSEGGYWVAVVFGNAIRRYLPNGELDLEVKLPFDNPTKVAFGGPDLSTLYVTTTQIVYPGSENANQDMLGAVYAFETDFRGIEEPRFAA